MELDEIDRRLISLLREDGRLSYTRLGELLGYTLMGAKRRVRKLIDRGVLKITALESVEALRFRGALIMLEVADRRSLEDLLRRFRDCPRIIYLFTLMAGYNLAALMVAEDEETLESEAWERCSIRSQPGVRRSEFYPIGEVYFSPYLPIRFELWGMNLERAPCGVDCGVCERYRDRRCRGCPSTRLYRFD